MSDDERAIRDLVASWMSASRRGDTATVLSLMADDVIFMVPGRAPFGKTEFAAGSQEQQGALVDGTCDIRELEVAGDWAYVRNYIEVSLARPGDAQPQRFAGYTLTVLRKQADGRWLLSRDANLVLPQGA